MMKEDRGGCGADDLATEANSQVVANRKNAKRSTGPRTAPGKATSSQNAIRHGLLSSKMLLNDEDPAEFDALLLDLHRSLNPVGVIELALAERIAVSLWRQSRLVAAEAAEITLERRAGAVAKAVGRLEDLGLSWEIGPGALLPVDEDDVAWCEAVIAEVLAGNELSMANLRDKAPTIHEALVCEAEDDEETPERFIEQFPEGLTSYVSQLYVACRKQLAEVMAQRRLLDLAVHVRQKNMILPSHQLEVIARYQTTLDNQLYKALRALRDEQEARLETLEAMAEPVDAVAS